VKLPSALEQAKFWNDWVSRSFEWEENPDNARRGFYVLREVAKNERPGLKILDVGCGSGWLSRMLQKHGEVTATDFAFKTIDTLKQQYPEIKWIAGDFVEVDLPESHFDIVACLETIAHVPDQEAFADRIARVLRPDGLLLLTTQNEYVWSRTSSLKPPGEGQIRNWPSQERLKCLFAASFSIEKLFTCAPGGDRGLPWVFNNRVSIRFWSRLIGEKPYIRIRESLGLGRSLVLVGRRLEN
jgi:2-polyprenyl-3-methyl-5-hydroxy-6-metoxy-1,4-benzoquinol methylase